MKTLHNWWSNFLLDFEIAYAWTFVPVRMNFDGNYEKFDSWYRAKHDVGVADPLATL